MDFPITIAYNMDLKKIGCPLAQAVLGSTFGGGQVSRHFDTNCWDINITRSRLFTIKSQEEFDKMKEITINANKT